MIIQPAFLPGATCKERGLAPATELVIIVPAIMILLGLVVAGGRIWLARSAVSEAAYSAARAASIERSAGAGGEAGRRAAVRELHTDGLQCRSQTVETDTSGFATPAGKPAQVRADVACTVALDDLLLPGMPGHLTLRGTGAAALDTYRGR